jgi:hypothetical protein
MSWKSKIDLWYDCCGHYVTIYDPQVCVVCGRRICDDCYTVSEHGANCADCAPEPASQSVESWLTGTPFLDAT